MKETYAVKSKIKKRKSRERFPLLLNLLEF